MPVYHTTNDATGPLELETWRLPRSTTPPLAGTTVRVYAHFSRSNVNCDADMHVEVTTPEGVVLDSGNYRVEHDEEGLYYVALVPDVSGLWAVRLWTEGNDAVAALVDFWVND